MAQNFFGSICLSDIPKELITTGKNGKKYLSVVVNERREVGQFGHTHYIKAYVKKGTPVDPNANLYIGELKPSEFNDDPRTQVITAKAGSPTPPPPKDDDDLPF